MIIYNSRQSLVEIGCKNMNSRTIFVLLLIVLSSISTNAQNWPSLLSRNTMGQPLMATPALSQGMLIVRGQNAIYALGEGKSARNRTQ